MMNKFVYYFFFLMATTAIVFLTSCEEDPEIPGGDPSVSLSPSDDVQTAPGDTVEVTVTLSNVSSGTEATAVSNPGGDGFVDNDNTAASGESVAFIVPDDAALGTTYTLTVSVTDGGSQANAQLTITVGYATVADIAAKNSDFSIFAAALTEAGLVADLQGDGPFTVFAPTNAAFEALMDSLGIDQDGLLALPNLADILSYHVIPERILEANLAEGNLGTWLEGDSVTISFGAEPMVNDAVIMVSATDIEADNGVVHAIDKVLLIPNSVIYEAFLLYSPTGDGNSQTFFSTTTGETYSNEEVTGTQEAISPTIDFGYYYGLNTNASLASPAAYPTSVFDIIGEGWSTYNETLFRTTTLSAEAFDAIKNYQADLFETEFEAGTSPANDGRATGLAAGDVIAFLTDADKEGGSKFGLIKVVEIVDGDQDGKFDGAADGIRIEVKVEE